MSCKTADECRKTHVPKCAQLSNTLLKYANSVVMQIMWLTQQETKGVINMEFRRRLPVEGEKWGLLHKMVMLYLFNWIGARNVLILL